MLIFFIITDKMLKSNQMSESTIAGKYNYILKEGSFMGPALFGDAGQALNYAQLNKIKENFIICRGLIDQKDAMLGLEAVLVGNIVSSFKVIVDEITKISGV